MAAEVLHGKMSRKPKVSKLDAPVLDSLLDAEERARQGVVRRRRVGMTPKEIFRYNQRMAREAGQ